MPKSILIICSLILCLQTSNICNDKMRHVIKKICNKNCALPILWFNETCYMYYVVFKFCAFPILSMPIMLFNFFSCKKNTETYTRNYENNFKFPHYVKETRSKILKRNTKFVIINKGVEL